MAVPSISLAYRRSALMTATKVTQKPPSKEVLQARDNFAAFCKIMGKPPAKHMLEWHIQLCTGKDSECLAAEYKEWLVQDIDNNVIALHKTDKKDLKYLLRKVD